MRIKQWADRDYEILVTHRDEEGRYEFEAWVEFDCDRHGAYDIGRVELVNFVCGVNPETGGSYCLRDSDIWDNIESVVADRADLIGANIRSEYSYAEEPIYPWES